MALTHTHTHKTLNKKSQSAMEYLMTYGWAILIIAVVLGVLFQLGVFSGSALAPKAQPGSCQVQRLLGQVSLEGLCQGQLPEYTAAYNALVNSYIQVANAPILNMPSQVTISTWIETTYTNSGGWEYIFNPNGGGTCDSLGYCLRWGSNLIYFSLGTVGGYNNWVTFSQSLIDNGQWHMITGTYNGFVQLAYVDGTLQGSSSVSGSTITPIGSHIYIGGVSFTGSLANIQVYNTSLNANEVKALYQEGIGGAPVRLQNLVGWWPLNGNGNDYSSYNNNGQATGSVSFNNSWSSSYTPP